MKKFTKEELNNYDIQSRYNIITRLDDILVWKFKYEWKKDEFFKEINNDIANSKTQSDKLRNINILIINLEQKAIELLNEKSIIDIL